MKLPIYEELKKEMLSCDKCGLGGSLLDGYDPHVIGQGSLEAKIMFIAEAGGFNETVNRQPLTTTGVSGKVYESLLAKLNLTRNDVFTSNVLVCRPPENRDPEVFEIEICSSFLRRQIELVNPKLIVSFGRFSSQYLLGKIKITQDHGKIHHSKKFNVDVFPLYHPAYISAYATQERRDEFKEDVKVLKNIIDNIM